MGESLCRHGRVFLLLLGIFSSLSGPHVDAVYCCVSNGLWSSPGGTTGSCVGRCGGSANGCWCDDACFDIGDCCVDARTACWVPSITSVSQSGQVISLVGDHFLNTQQTARLVHPTYAPSAPPLVPVTWETTKTALNLPAGVGAGYTVSITTVFTFYQYTWTLTGSAAFSYPAPTCATIGTQNGPTDGGTTVVLTGTNFGGVNKAFVTVTVGGQSGTVTANTATTTTFTTPPGQGLAQAVVHTVGGQTCNPASASFNYDKPVVTLITTTNPVTQGGGSMVITGVSLGLSGSVTVAGVATTCSVWGHKSITCVVPPGEGTGQSVVVTVSSQSSLGYNIDYSRPVLSNISPKTGSTAGGTLVTLTGSSMGRTNVQVTFGSFTCTTTSVACVIQTKSDQSITLLTPAGQDINLPVRVTASGLTSDPVTFSYAAPSITLPFLPAGIGSTQGGDPMTINGLNFFTTATVTVGGSDCPVTSRTPNTQLVCTLPAGQGVKDVIVKVATQSSPTGVQFSYRSPVITGVTPAMGPTAGGGTPNVVISGSDFGFSGTVTLVPATGSSFICFPVSWSHTSISITPPAGEGIGLRVVVTSGGLSSTQSFVYSYTAPTISDIAPLVGSSAGSIPITIKGNNFGITPRITVDGNNCPTSFVSDTQVVCTLPAGAGVNKNIVFTALGQTPLNPMNFKFSYNVPSLTSVSPLLSVTNGGGSVVLLGTSFTASGSVTIDGKPCTSPVWGHSQITCTVPPGQGVNLVVLLTTSDNRQSSLATFGYIAPSITDVNPKSGVTSGQGVLTLSGVNFGPQTTNLPTISVGGLNCPLVALPVGADPHSQLRCTIPAGQGVSKQVIATVASQASNPQTYSYSPPSISNIFPPNGPTIGGGLLTLTGSSFGFSAGAPDSITVTLGSRACVVINGGQTHTQVTCTIPAGSGVSQGLVVTVGLQPSTSAVSYNYDKPVLVFLRPLLSPTLGNQPMILNGFNFGPPTATVLVQIGGVPYTATSSNHTVVNINSPAGEGLNVAVVVAVDGQVSNTLALGYIAPAITNVQPSPGVTQGTTPLTVDGTNFGTSGTVLVNNNPCTPGSTSGHTRIICTLPPGQGTTVPITVTVKSQISPAWNSFTYGPPAITGISPNVGPTTGNTPIVITGQNFGTSGSVTLGLVEKFPCLPVSNGYSHLSITCTLPGGQGFGLDFVVTSSGRTSSVVVADRFSYAAPTIATVAPATGVTGGNTAITLSGTNFGLSGGTVTIGGKPCPTTSYSHLQVVCTLPVGSGKNLDVVFALTGQPSATKTAAFSYSDPTISNVSPLFANSIGGSLFTITGNSFDLSGTVTVGPITNFCTQNVAMGTSWSHTSIVCLLPAGEGTSQSVVVTTVSGFVSTSTPTTFDYNPPSLGGLNPTTGPTSGLIGTSQVVLTLTGASFGVNPSVTVGTTQCPIVTKSHITITCNLPAGSGTNRPVVVSVGVRTSSSIAFSYDAPNILTVSPQNGPTLGGTRVTLTGTSFGATGSVVIGSRTCTLVTGQYSHTTLQCLLPAGEGTNLPIQLTVSSQLSTSAVSYSYGAPVINRLIPSNGPSAGTIPISIIGSNFGLGGALVQVGGNTCAPPSTWFNHTVIVCALPAGEGTSRDVRVTLGSLISPSVQFNYDKPVITSISPNSGLTAGSTPIVVSGLNFGTTSTSALITIGGVACAVSTQTDSTIRCSTPSGVGQNLPVVVTVSGQTSNNDKVFSYAAPTLSTIVPTSGPTVGKILLTLTGLSFGTSGTVTVGGTACPVVSYSQSSLTCTLPAGQDRSKAVILTVASLPSNALNFDYNAPTIAGLTPVNGPTAGQVPITITGANFGLSGVVTVGGSVCAQTGTSALYQDDRIVCLLPQGSGLSQPLLLQVGVQSVSRTFDYLPPIISNVSPLNGPTSGNVDITLIGTNFGCITGPTSLIALTVAGAPTTVTSCSHTNVVFKLPVGSGVQTVMSVTVNSQPASINTFAYLPPVISKVSGCVSDSSIAAVDCNNGGTGSTLTIAGSNFGTSSSLTINNIPCTPTYLIAHSKVTCPLPSGVGFNLPVVITVAGQSDSKPYLSYAGPRFIGGSLTLVSPVTNEEGLQRVAPSVPHHGSIGLFAGSNITVNVGSRISFSGQFLSTDVSIMSVGIGAPNQKSVYNCSNLAVTLVGTTYTVSCTIPQGVGRFLTLRVVKVITQGTQFSSESTDYLSYPDPVITDGTLKSQFGAQGTVLIGTESAGQIVLFRGTNFGTDASLLTVKYGPISQLSNPSGSQSLVFQCQNVLLASAGQVQCTTQPGASKNNRFVVTALNAPSAAGNDLYNYPTPPIVSSITSTACVVNGTQVVNCPTGGGVTITINGANFASGATSIKVGAADCTNAAVISVNVTTCTLPAGTGLQQTVVAVVGKLFSIGVNLVSYNPPTVTSVLGCTANPLSVLSITTCSRTGGNVITVSGANFGPSGAIVLAGGASCLNVQHDVTNPNGKLTCTLAAGTGTGLALLVIQGNGVPSTDLVEVSYAPCPAGQYPDPTPQSVACLDCNAGSITASAGQLQCTECEGGFFTSSPAQTQCSKCAAGFYSVRRLVNNVVRGAVGCTPCTKGSFAATSAQQSCDLCPPGRYSKNDQASECTRCEAGRATGVNVFGAVSCSVCGIGSYSTVGSIECAQCAPGTYSNGTFPCTPCDKGKFQATGGQPACDVCQKGFAVNSLGQVACTACPSGFFSNDTNLLNCLRCPAGTYSAKTSTGGGGGGPTQCTMCPIGSYIDVPAQGTCLFCQQGTAQAGMGATVCPACVPGKAAQQTGQPTCTDCAAGYYSFSSGAPFCQKCDVGRFANAPGFSECQQCAAGKFQDTLGGQTCKDCDKDTITSALGQSQCSRCPDGNFAGSMADMCSPCTVGTFKTASSAAGTCSACSDGTYINSVGQAQCLQCAPGFVAQGSNNVNCTACAVGKAAAGPGNKACTDCNIGEFSSAVGSSQCELCPAGRSQSLKGQSKCTVCDIGTSQSQVGQMSCVACAKGSYQDATGQLSCLVCPVGTYQPNPGSSSCIPCDLGFVQSNPGAVQPCTACAQGFFTNATAQATCLVCPAGTAQPNAGQSKCVPCGKGTAASQPQSAMCTDCAKGSFAASTGQITCDQCAPGYVANGVKSTACSPCSPGTYQRDSGKLTCDFCPVGQYAPGTAEIECFPCPSGSFNPSNSSVVAACQLCPVGKFQPSNGQVGCIDCTAGKSASNNGSLACDDCAVGFYANVGGLSKCKSCEAGRYQPSGGQMDCIKCSQGQYQTNPSQVACQPCQSGSFSNVTGGQVCLPCAAGFVSTYIGPSVIGPVNCTACVPGRWTSTTGQQQCDLCQAGTYNNEFGATACQPCAKGQFLGQRGGVKCGSCSGGQFSGSLRSLGCSMCPIGSYAIGPEATSCTLCDVGKYQALIGQAQCESCGAGFFSFPEGQASCLACPIGSFNNVSRNSGCQLCPAGRFQPASGQSVCIDCDVGYYNTAPGQGQCLECKLGEYGPVAGATGCNLCAVGTFSQISKATACLNCTVGRFGTQMAAISCFDCPIGFVSGVSGLTTCVACTPGRYQGTTGQASCTACPGGKYAPGKGEVACLSCPIGQYSDTSDGSDPALCKKCAPGKFTGVDGSVECAMCSAGLYSVNNGSVTCDKCPLGTYIDKRGQSACLVCPAGRFGSLTGQEQCSLCAAGTSQNNTGQSFCVACPSGQFAPRNGSSECTLCKAGSYSVKSGQIGPTTCTACPEGSYVSVQGQDSCKACSAGEEAPGLGSTACTPCLPGSYSGAAGTAKCSLCTAGFYTAGNGSIVCPICPIGKASAVAGSSSCLTCPKGTRQPAAGQLKCLGCDTGSFGVADGQGACSSCGPGKFANSSTQSACYDCLAGKATNSSGQRLCADCDLGKFMPNTGQVSCSQCPLGTSANVTGLSACNQCQPGRFQDQVGMAACNPCPTGKFINALGVSECLGCPIGTYNDQLGQSACAPCLLGKFEVRSNSTRCQDCATGKYADFRMALACIGCKAGTFSNITGLPVCYPCNPGTYQNKTETTTCDPCDIGKFANLFAQKECKGCEPGTFSDRKGLAVCTGCPTGKYMPGFGATKCIDCPINQYSDVIGQPACLLCPPGRYGNTTGLPVCYACPSGKFTSGFGSGGCKDCTTGEYSGPGQPACDPCPPGTKNDKRGQGVCQSCVRGMFQDLKNQTVCKDCALGTFSASLGQALCSPCPAGTFAVGTGLSVCASCQPGFFMPNTSALQCAQCPAGKFSNKTESKLCDDCPPGTASTAIQAIKCASCQIGYFASGVGNQQCAPCGAGRYIDQPSSPSCAPCSSGKFNAGTAKTVCDPCQTGKFQSSQAQQACTQCPPGRFTNKQGEVTCLFCAPSTFAKNPEQTACDRCPPGQFQNSSGSSFCYGCEPGLFSATNGRVDCDECPQGSFTNETGRSSCRSCDPGTFNNATKRVACTPCAVGQFAALTGQISCNLCPIGTFSNSLKTVTCSGCPSGYFSDTLGRLQCKPCTIGFYTGTTGLSLCDGCPAGTFGQFGNASACTNCPLGKFNRQTAALSCNPCPQGEFAGVEGRSACQACDAGTFNALEGQLGCSKCSPGYFTAQQHSTVCLGCSVGYFSLNGTAVCQQCPPGTISPTNTSTTCSSCGRNAVPNSFRSECICDVDYYAAADSSGLTCVGCPLGADCTQPGTKWVSILSLSGYWRATSNSTVFYRCVREDQCPGGPPGTCGANRIPPLCAQCRKDYHSYFGGDCIECPSASAAYVFVIFTFLAMVIAYIAMAYVVMRGGKDLLHAESAMARKRALHTGTVDAFDDDDEFDFEEKTVTLSEDYLIKRPAEFMFKMKIIIGFLQILTNVGISLEVQWPTAFKSFLSWFALFNIDFVEATSLSCIADASFYNKFILMICAPPAIIAAVCVFYLFPLYLWVDYKLRQAKLSEKMNLEDDEKAAEFTDGRHAAISIDKKEQHIERKMVRRNAWKILIFTMFLIYPVVSSTVLRLYVCKNIEGVDYLFADFTKVCYTSEWNTFSAIGYVMIVVYPIGIPCFFLFMLYRYKSRKRLHDPGVKAELGFLYDAFDNSMWWFEMADMLHKLITTSLLAFFPPSVQLPIGLCVVTAYLVAILNLKPYKRKGDDKLHLLVQVELWLYIYAGYMFYLVDKPNKQTNVTLSVVLIGGVCLLMLFFFSQILRALWKVYKAWKAKQEEKQQATIGKPLKKQDSEMELQITRTKTTKRLQAVRASTSDDVKLTRNPLATAPVTVAEGSADLVSNPLYETSRLDTGAGAGAAGAAPTAVAVAVDKSKGVKFVRQKSSRNHKRGSILAGPDVDDDDDSASPRSGADASRDDLNMSSNPLRQHDTASNSSSAQLVRVQSSGGSGENESAATSASVSPRSANDPHSPSNVLLHHSASDASIE